MIKDYFGFSIKSIARRKLRSWLTIIGIIIGIAAIVALISVSSGLQTAVEEQFKKMGTQTIRIVPKGLRGPPISTDVLTTKEVDAVEKIKGVEYVATVLLQNANLEFDKEKQLRQVAGWDSDIIKEAFEDMDAEIEQGKLFEKDGYHAVIGYSAAYKFFERDVKLRNNILIDDEKFKVVGILEKTGTPPIDDSVYIPLETARSLFGKPGGVSVINAKVFDGLDIDEIAEKIETKLERLRDDENFEVLTPQQIINQLNRILDVVKFVLIGIAAISLVVGGIGIMNSMFTSVLERTREIGVMKAIGARNADVLVIFVVEAGLIGLVGGLVGALLGTGIAFLVQGIAENLGFGLLKVTVGYRLILFGACFAFLVGMVSGIVPAIRAARLKPVDALRYE